ncbi:putative HTH-type transcriptional regulator YxaF [compost metagenome]
MNLKSKEIILETAVRLFDKRGYHGTRLEQIIKESGSTKASLYYHFPNGKEELAIESAKIISQRVQNILQYYIFRDKEPVDFLRAFVLSIAESIDTSGPDNLAPFGFLATVEISTVSASLRNACKVAFRDWKESLSNKFIETGIGRDSAEKMAEILVCLIEGATTIAIAEGDSQAIRRITEYIPMILLSNR